MNIFQHLIYTRPDKQFDMVENPTPLVKPWFLYMDDCDTRSFIKDMPQKTKKMLEGSCFVVRSLGKMEAFYNLRGVFTSNKLPELNSYNV